MYFSSFNALLLLLATLSGPSSGACVPGVKTWWHDKSTIDIQSPAAPDEVRRSRTYEVSVSPARTSRFQRSFVYESIPRNGNGKIFDPAQPGKEYNLTDGDGVTVEIDARISMAWTQFQYRRDVDFRVISSDRSALGPASNIVIRPVDVGFEVRSPQPDTVVIRVPYQKSGARFSVGFQDDLYTFRSNGTDYVTEGGVTVSEEPKNALLIFASPMIPDDLIPSKTSTGTQVMKPGRLTREALGSKPTLYFEAGVYWVEKDGILGKDHIKLFPSTHYVYFEPGTYIKGAFEYTTRHPDFYTVGHAVVSGENYAYMANTIKDCTAVKDDRYSLRMFWHQSVMDNQTWYCIGPTLNAPPFNTMDLHPMNHTPHEEDNKVQSHIQDYKQVGAFYFQTDGTQMYKGTVRDVFWHVNDDAIKLYHAGAQLEGLTVWKARNNAIIQMGWKPRDVSDVSVKHVRLIHNRWIQPNAYVPSAILGASPFYADPKLVDPSRKMSLHISDLVCEGVCAALMTMAPLQNFDLLVENVHFEKMHDDVTVRLGHSVVGMDAGENMNNYTPGQGNLTLGIVIRNWTIGGQRVDALLSKDPDGAAILHYNEKRTSDNRAFGGVFPVIALAGHGATLAELVNESLPFLPDAESTSPNTITVRGRQKQQPDFVSVTRGPGMLANLSAGLHTAKGIAAAWQVPLVAVNHMQAHALTPRLVTALARGEKTAAGNGAARPAEPKRTGPEPAFPFLSLLVSGGHTMLVHSRALNDHRILAEADSAIAIGDALDKAARQVLPASLIASTDDVMYGRLLERFVFPRAADGRAIDYAYTPPRIRADEIATYRSPHGWHLTPPFATTRRMRYDFSGFGSQVQRIAEARPDMSEAERRDLGRDTMRILFEHLASRVVLALGNEEMGLRDVRTLVVAGGVASNRYLMHVLRAFLDVRGYNGIEITAPPVELCTDNAAMIAWTGVEMFEAGYESELSVHSIKKWPLDPTGDDGGILGAKGWVKRR
ncbi:hypothetical protein VD0004_g596 [Verticillium dahliae]|nr:hypothetical protein VD0004_g596 [Verticillium dahliae]